MSSIGGSPYPSCATVFGGVRRGPKRRLAMAVEPNASKKAGASSEMSGHLCQILKFVTSDDYCKEETLLTSHLVPTLYCYGARTHPSAFPMFHVMQTASFGRNRPSRISRSQRSPQRADDHSSYGGSTMYGGGQGMPDFRPGGELLEDATEMEHQLFWSTCRPHQVRQCRCVSSWQVVHVSFHI